MKKPFLKMADQERDAEAQKWQSGISYHQTRPLSRRSQVLWAMAKRGPGRPRKPEGEKAQRVLISLDPRLLAVVEAYASANDLDRSRLFALSVEAFMAADKAH